MHEDAVTVSNALQHIDVPPPEWLVEKVNLVKLALPWSTAFAMKTFLTKHLVLLKFKNDNFDVFEILQEILQLQCKYNLTSHNRAYFLGKSWKQKSLKFPSIV